MRSEHPLSMVKECARLALFGLAALFTVWIYYPGVMTPDSAASYNEALGRQISDNYHPTSFALLWQITMVFLDGPAGMLILQNVLFWGGLYLIGRFGFLAVGRSSIWGLLIGLFPPLWSQLGSIWKDVMMLSLFSATLGLLFVAIYLRRRWILVGALVLTVMAATMRHNSLSCTIPLAMVISYLWCSLGQNPVPIRAILTRGLVLGIVTSLLAAQINIMAAEKSGAVWQTLLSYELVAVSKRCERSFPDTIWGPRSMDDLAQIYSPYGNAKTFWSLIWPISAPEPDIIPEFHGTASPPPEVPFISAYLTDPEKLSLVKSAWVAAILECPASYLRHKTSLAGSLLGVNIKEVIYPYQDSIIYNLAPIVGFPTAPPDSYRFSVNRVMTAIFFSLKDTFLYRGWVYFLISVVLLARVVSLFGVKWNKQLLVFSLGPVVSISTVVILVMVTPSSDFRYLLPSVFGVLFVLPVVFGSSNSE